MKNKTNAKKPSKPKDGKKGNKIVKEISTQAQIILLNNAVVELCNNNLDLVSHGLSLEERVKELEDLHPIIEEKRNIEMKKGLIQVAGRNDISFEEQLKQRGEG